MTGKSFALLFGLLAFVFQPAMGQNFDHSEFDNLLKKYVNNRGQVNYKDLIAMDNAVFESYLAKLAGANLASMGQKEKLAFWINAYNACVIKGVIKRYPVKSVMDYPGFFKEVFFKVAGKTYSADQIEHEIIRPTFNDPRVHFVLVCAAKGCPILQNSAFMTSNVEDKLERGAKNYLNDKSQNYVDDNAKAIFVSQIFNWFAGDFEKSKEGSVRDFVRSYIDHPDKIALSDYTIKYVDYDWSLNSQ